MNKYSWNKKANVLYVDFPLGEGFSFEDDFFKGQITEKKLSQ